jgi:hypothetical protein
MEARMSANSKAIPTAAWTVKDFASGAIAIAVFLLTSFFLPGLSYVSVVMLGFPASLGSVALSAVRMDVFEPVAAFAFFVLAVLLVLHIFQWAVAARLRAAFPTNANTFR